MQISFLKETHKVMSDNVRRMTAITLFTALSLAVNPAAHAQPETAVDTQAFTAGTTAPQISRDAPLPVSSEHLLRWYGFRVYMVRLEVSQRGVDPLSDVRKRMSITYERPFTATDITKAARKLLKRTDGIDYDSLVSRLDQIDAVYKDVKVGDTYTLDYTPDVGMTLLLNGQALTTVPGADFARSYYGMWLGKVSPISEDLREHLLEGIGVEPEA